MSGYKNEGYEQYPPPYSSSGPAMAPPQQMPPPYNFTAYPTPPQGAPQMYPNQGNAAPPPPGFVQPNPYNPVYNHPGVESTHVYVDENGDYKPANADPGLDAAFGSSFFDKAIRRAFIRKVYAVLVLQLGVTFSIVMIFTFVSPIKHFVQRTPGIYIASYIVFIITYFTLVCVPSVRRTSPGNYIALCVFTLAMSFMTGAIASTYDTQIVVMAFGICVAVCTAITLFSFYTKFDFTGCYGILCASLFTLVMFGILAVFTYDRIMYTIYSGIAALIFMVLLAVETQMIMGGKRYNFSPEEYISASLNLYMDIVLIFTYILGFSGRSS